MTVAVARAFLHVGAMTKRFLWFKIPLTVFKIRIRDQFDRLSNITLTTKCHEGMPWILFLQGNNLANGLYIAIPSRKQIWSVDLK